MVLAREHSQKIGSDIEVTIERGFDAALDLKGQWDDLALRSGVRYPFASYEWTRRWSDAFDIKTQATLVCARQSGLLVAVLPLMYRDTQIAGISIRRLTTWVNTHSFRSAILADPAYPNALAACIAELGNVGDWDLLDAPYLPETVDSTERFRNSLISAGYKVQSTKGMSSPRLQVQGDWQGFVSALSKSRREGERRKARKLLDRENARISISVGAVDNIGDRLADCWAVSSRTWKHEAGSSIASSPERIRFYESIAKSDRNWLVLGLLHRGGEAIAFEYNLLENGSLYNLKLGFDERFRSLSPGQVLRFKMLEWAFENDVRVFDFMGNAADYKVAYSSDTLTHQNLRVYSSTPKARMLAAYEFDVRPLLRAVKANLSITKKA